MGEIPTRDDIFVSSPDEAGVRVVVRGDKQFLTDGELRIYHELLAQTGVDLAKWDEARCDIVSDRVNIFIIKSNPDPSKNVFASYRRNGNVFMFNDHFMNLLHHPHESKKHYLPEGVITDYAMAHELVHYHIKNRVNPKERNNIIDFYRQNADLFSQSTNALLANDMYKKQIVNNSQLNIESGTSSYYLTKELTLNGVTRDYPIDAYEVFAELIAHEILYSKFVADPEDREKLVRYTEADFEGSSKVTSNRISLEAHREFHLLQQQFTEFRQILSTITNSQSLRSEVIQLKRILLNEKIGV